MKRQLPSERSTIRPTSSSGSGSPTSSTDQRRRVRGRECRQFDDPPARGRVLDGPRRRGLDEGGTRRGQDQAPRDGGRGARRIQEGHDVEAGPVEVLHEPHLHPVAGQRVKPLEPGGEAGRPVGEPSCTGAGGRSGAGEAEQLVRHHGRAGVGVTRRRESRRSADRRPRAPRAGMPASRMAAWASGRSGSNGPRGFRAQADAPDEGRGLQARDVAGERLEQAGLADPGRGQHEPSLGRPSMGRRWSAASSSASWASRPIVGARSEPIASSRDRCARTPTTRKARTGVALPLNDSGATASISIASATASAVASPTRTVPGSAAVCSRAAVLTVSPVTRPASGPSTAWTTSPVLTPTRSRRSLPSRSRRAPSRSTASTRARPVRTARSASSSRPRARRRRPSPRRR